MAFIGGGSMAKCLAEAFVRANIVRPEEIVMSARSPASLQEITKLGYIACSSNDEVLRAARGSVVFLCVKPGDACATLRNLDARLLSEVRVVASVCVSLTIKELTSCLPEITGATPPKIVRIMPSVLCAIGKGATALCLGNHGEEELIYPFVKACGAVFKISESQMDAFTAVAASAPAFVFTFIEAMSDAAVLNGLSRGMATELAVHTAMGSGALALDQLGKRHISELRESIMSPGGTTVVGHRALEKGNFRFTVMDAISAVVDKSKQMNA